MECRVCHMPDPGNHHCESCCRACAAFFRRTVQLKIRYRCKKFGNCQITKDNRFSCRFCRMKRCIAVGMTSHEDPGASMEFYLDGSHSSSTESLPSLIEDDFYSYDNIFNNTDFSNRLADRLQELLLNSRQKSSKYPFKLTLCQQAMTAYEQHEAKWPKCSREKVTHSRIFDFNEVMRDSLKASEYAAEFSMEIEPFANLPLDQKKLLMAPFVTRFLHFDRLFTTIRILGNNVNDTRTVYHNGQAADCRKLEMDVSRVTEGADDYLKSFLTGMEEVFVNYFMKQFKRLNPDRFELMFLFVSSLWNSNGKVLDGISEETLKVGSEVEQQLGEELYAYYQFHKKYENYASRIYKLQNLLTCLDKIEELTIQDLCLAKTFDIMKINTLFPDLTQ